MFINRLNQLYKPERVLYYTDATANDATAYRDGTLAEELTRAMGAFGTYDDPGIFYLADQETPVIGIEYRKNDSRIAYPENLKSVVLSGTFFYSIEIDRDIDLAPENLRHIFAEIAKDDDAHRITNDLAICDKPSIISIFASHERKKLRILYECALTEDRAPRVMEDDFSRFTQGDLYKMAFTDPITDYYTWNHLVPYLEMPMDAGIRDYAFAHFDIKAFKAVNDIYGHIAANKVLSNVVRNMNEADFVYTGARCHNDNFAMLIKDMPQEETKAKLEQFFEKCSYLEEDPNYKIYFRCGLVPMQRAVLSGNRVADAAKLAQSRGTTPNRTDITLYTDKMHDDTLWVCYIKAYADTAIENDEFMVYLQPKFDINQEHIKGAEALIRWNYKKQEFLAPYRFIPFFEKDGSIGKIDDLVLEQVCAMLAKWKAEGKPLYPISVNLSRVRMYDEKLMDHLVGVVDSYGVDHSLIDFELTESATYDDKGHMLDVLEELKKRGFKISMDDFGTGYSSFSLLTEMPIDTLKIDKSFVDKLGTKEESPKDVVVIQHIVSLAKELGFICLAEGAEEACQVERLRSLHCNLIQGYYYCKPIPIAEYEQKYL